MSTKIAFDIGGVIFNEEAFELTREAIKSVVEIIQKFHRNNVYIISKAGLKIREIIMLKLDESDFFHITGLNRNNVHFVFEYEDKVTKCMELGINYIIDDHIKIIRFILHEPKCSTIPVWFGDNTTKVDSLNDHGNGNDNGSTITNHINRKITTKHIGNCIDIQNPLLCSSWRHVRKLFQRVKRNRI